MEAKAKEKETTRGIESKKDNRRGDRKSTWRLGEQLQRENRGRRGDIYIFKQPVKSNKEM